MSFRNSSGIVVMIIIITYLLYVLFTATNTRRVRKPNLKNNIVSVTPPCAMSEFPTPGSSTTTVHMHNQQLCYVLVYIIIMKKIKIKTKTHCGATNAAFTMLGVCK